MRSHLRTSAAPPELSAACRRALSWDQWHCMRFFATCKARPPRTPHARASRRLSDDCRHLSGGSLAVSAGRSASGRCSVRSVRTPPSPEIAPLLNHAPSWPKWRSGTSLRPRFFVGIVQSAVRRTLFDFADNRLREIKARSPLCNGHLIAQGSALPTQLSRRSISLTNMCVHHCGWGCIRIPSMYSADCISIYVCSFLFTV